MLETQNRILAELAESRRTQATIQATQSKILADQEESRQTRTAMQETIAAILETQNELLADRDETRRTQAAMQETIAAILESQNSLLQAQNRISEDIRALHSMYRQYREDFGRFRGNYAIDAARQNENATLWYKLEERKLEPLDSC